MGGESAAYALWFGLTGKVELREEDPEAAPAAGEDAGPSGNGDVAELQKDVDKKVVGQRADAVMAAAGGGDAVFRSSGGGLPITVLHGGEIWGLGVGGQAVGGCLKSGSDSGDRSRFGR